MWLAGNLAWDQSCPPGRVSVSGRTAVGSPLNTEPPEMGAWCFLSLPFLIVINYRIFLVLIQFIPSVNVSCPCQERHRHVFVISIIISGNAYHIDQLSLKCIEEYISDLVWTKKNCSRNSTELMVIKKIFNTTNDWQIHSMLEASQSSRLLSYSSFSLPITE